MYSVVVLMALSTGGEAVEARGGRGCGSSSCCYSSCCYSYCAPYSCGYYCAPVSYYSCGVPYYGCGPVIMTAPGKKEKEEKKKKEEETSTSATIVVNLPAEATLTIDGAATVSTSAKRVFSSPELEEGKQFHYTFKARIMRDGKPVVFEKTVAVEAGKTVEITMTAPVADVAAN